MKAFIVLIKMLALGLIMSLFVIVNFIIAPPIVAFFVVLIYLGVLYIFFHKWLKELDNDI